MKNREKFIFWSLLFILVISRIIKIINAHSSGGDEQHNLFVSSYIASGACPTPLLFQDNRPHAGGGNLLYSIMAVPFIWLFGMSYFSLRLASIVFLILTYLVTYRFCRKYFGLVAAAFASSLFVITPGLLTGFSIAGQGRHFHLNLFFVLSLYCLAKIKDTKRLLYYLLLGITCGLGVYFYPAFLITVFVLGLFLLFDMDVNRPSSVFGYLMIAAGVILACNFLQFGTPWYDNLFEVLLAVLTKNIAIRGDIFSMLTRHAKLLLQYIPNIFASSEENFKALFEGSLFKKEYFNNPTVLSRIPLEIFRAIFIACCAGLCWINRRGLKFNAFFQKGEHAIPTRSYISIFLLVHLFTYIFIYGLNRRQMATYAYHITLYLNIVVLIAIFLNEVWQRNKSLPVILLIFALSPGIIYQYHNFTKASVKDFYKHYIYFCCAKGTTDLVRNKPVLAHKRMCDKLHIIICHTIGKEYAAGWGASKRLDKIKKDFEYIGGGDIRKLKYLYQGYIYNKVVNSKHEIKETFSTIIEKIDKRYREFCYIGLGEGLFDLVYFKKAEFDFAKNMEMIEEYNPFVEEAYKGYFFQGIGEGLAKMFAQPYSPYITDKGLNDHKILENYFKAINNQECRKAFLAGFCNKDIWSPY